MTRPIYINGRFLGAQFSGVQRTAVELVKALDRILAQYSASGCPNFSVELLHPPGIRAAPDFRFISVREVGSRSGQYWEQIELLKASRGGTLVSLCNAAPLLKRDAFTMVHDAQVYTAPGSYGALFRLWYKVAQPIMGRLHRRILTVSQFSLNELVALKIAPRGKINCIPNGCDHVLSLEADPFVLEKFGLQKDNFTVSLANTQPHKNIGLLLRAFEDARLAGHTLVLFGSASAADFTGRGYRIPANVRFLGKVTDRELAGLLKNATAFACPSLTEGFGLMPLEAMALGCPAIIAPCGALPEVCGNAALSADPHEPGEWVAQITQLLGSPVLTDELRQKGFRRAALFSWDASAKALLDLLVDERRDRSHG